MATLSFEDNKCSRCSGPKCCTYITQGLIAPRSKADFEHLLWQVSHAGVEVYKDSTGWYLLIHSRCDHLLADGRCGIYEQRPPICREYANDFCEFDAPAEESFDLHFRNHTSLLAYCRKRFRTWGR